MTVMDERKNLINDICMGLISFDIDIADVKDMLYIALEPYEITNRSTELAEVSQDRNEYLVSKFLISKTVKGCTKRTIQYYGMIVRKILDAIGKTVDDITQDDILYYMALRQRRDHIQKVTADNELRCLKSFFQYLTAEELITKNPTAKIDRIKCEKRVKEIFTDVEIEKIRMAARGEREKLLVEVMLSTGCRVSELVGIRLDEIDGNRVLLHGKGEKDRYAYLTAKAVVMLEVYVRERKDKNPYLFPGGKWDLASKKRMTDWWKDPESVTSDTCIDKGTVEAMMRKMAKRAGVERANPHKFRRTCATMALRRGMPIEQVSKMLGHEQISTTQIYLNLSEEELRLAHKKYVV